MIPLIQPSVPVRHSMFRLVASLSIALHVTVSFLGHFGMHALLGDSHCPEAVHCSSTVAKHSHAGEAEAQPATKHTHVGCPHHAHDGLANLPLVESTPAQSPDSDAPASDHRHPSHNEHSCEICSVLAQAQTAPVVVAQPEALLLLTELLTEVDRADAQCVANDYDSRGPPRC
jgi:hypothetical protein